MVRLVTVDTRPSLTRIPLYAGPLPAVVPDAPAWPGADLTSGGVTLHARRTPGPDGGELAVYLHGLGGSASNFTDLAGLLATRHPGMALDLPGFGRSRPPAGFDYALDSHAEVVARFLADLPRRPVHLAGNSMGGAVALLIAARHPELVRTLTLLAPAMPDLRVDPRRFSDPRMVLAFVPVVRAGARRRLAEVPAHERVEQMLRVCFADPSNVTAARRSAAAEEFIERAGLAWTAAALSRSTGGLIRSWLAPRARSLWQAATGVRAPALVVWGTADKLVSVRKAPRTARMLPRGRLFVLPRTGHVPQMERPTSVARAVLGMIDANAANAW